jgi:hypothetical protein
MKTMLEINKKKVPAVRIDSTLNKFDKVILFPEKLAKANEMIINSNIAEIMAKKGRAY